MDQEIVPGPCYSFEYLNSTEESELKLRKSTRRGESKWFYDIEDYVYVVSPVELDERNFITKTYGALKGING